VLLETADTKRRCLGEQKSQAQFLLLCFSDAPPHADPYRRLAPAHRAARPPTRALLHQDDQDRFAYLGWLHEALAGRAAYRELFRGVLDDPPLGDLRLAREQDKPITDDRFYREIEAMSGRRRGLRKRGRLRKQDEQPSAEDEG
jgi:hypothetical protein